MAVAVAARFEQDSTYGLFAGTKKWPSYRGGYCGRRWPLVKVRL